MVRAAGDAGYPRAMATVLVMGATGALGHSVVRACAEQGHAARAMVRRPRPGLFEDIEVENVAGDAADRASVVAALRGCDLLAYCVNVPLAEWADRMLPFLQNALAACTETGVKMVFPANVWVYGKGTPGELVDESRPRCPTSKKGRVRAAMEEAIESSGARYTMVRLPEFYGPNVANRLMGTPFTDALRGKDITWLGGDLDLTVEYVFMPDGARAMLQAGLAEGTDGQTFHVPGARHTTPRELLGLLAARTGVGVSSMPTWALRTAAIVHRGAREFADILHLWTHPILLDGTRYRERFGAVPATSYEDGVAITLEWFRAHPDAVNAN